MTFFSTPEYEPVYAIIDEYFGHPMLEKVGTHETFSLYAVEIASMLLNETRFLIVFVRDDPRPVGSKTPLVQLQWVSLQTRTIGHAGLEDKDLFEHRTLPPPTYMSQRGATSDVRISCVSRNSSITSYHASAYPIEVSLLHTKQNEFEYPQEGNLASALETFQTIVQFRPLS